MADTKLTAETPRGPIQAADLFRIARPGNPALDGSVNGADFAELIRDTIGATLVQGSNVTITVDDPGDKITIAASGGGSGGSSLPGKAPDISGRFYPADRYARANSTVAAGVLYAIPFRSPLDRTITGLALRVLTGASGTAVKVGIYEDVNGKPSNAGPLANSQGTADLSASASNAVVNFSAPVGLQKDKMYWVLIASNSTATVVGTATTDQLLPFYTGYTTNAPGGAYGSLTVSYTYGDTPAAGAMVEFAPSTAVGPLPYFVAQ